MNAFTKLFLLTVFVSGVFTQAPTPPTASQAMDTAIDAIISASCWKSADVASLNFTSTRRLQTMMGTTTATTGSTTGTTTGTTTGSTTGSTSTTGATTGTTTGTT